MKLFLKSNKGITAGIISLVLFLLLMAFPSISDLLYRKLIFQGIRMICDFTIGLIPISITLLVIPVAIFFMIRYLISAKITFKIVFLRIFNIMGILFALFLLLWGFNYTCPTLAQVHLPNNGKINSEQLLLLGREANQNAALLRKEITEMQVMNYSLSENEIRFYVENQLDQWNIPTIGRVRCRIISDGGFMRKLGVAGIYFPFGFEGITNDSYLSVTSCFIVAHEMSHGYSITDEGEADLVAYTALSNSSNKFFQYAAELELLRNVRGKLREENNDYFTQLKNETDSLVSRDLSAIRRNGLAYSEYFPGVQERMNNLYLKAMGVSAGTGSYESFTDLVWHFKQRLP